MLLVFGGSQGAQSSIVLSREPPNSLPPLVFRCCTHTVEERLRASRAAVTDPPYVALPYLSRMDLAYAAADLAICRSVR